MTRHLLPHELASAQIVSNFADLNFVQRHAPSLFATSGHPKMSERYGYTNTYALLQYLINRGFIVRYVQQTGKGAYGKLLIRMYHPRLPRTNDAEAQLVIIDSHDGTSAFKVYLGWFRFVCANGLILGDRVFGRSVKHTQPDLVEQVILDLDDAMDSMSSVQTLVRRMQDVQVDAQMLADMSLAVARARFDFDEMHDSRYARAAMALLPIRRQEDINPNLYTAMNVIQENALRGGMIYTYAGESHKVKPVSGIDRQTAVNQTVWQSAQDILDKLGV